MGRMTLTIDDNLIAEAQNLLGAKTKKETVQQALEELVRQKKRYRALTHCGEIELDIDQYLLKKLRDEG